MANPSFGGSEVRRQRTEDSRLGLAYGAPRKAKISNSPGSVNCGKVRTEREDFWSYSHATLLGRTSAVIWGKIVESKWNGQRDGPLVDS